MSNIGKKDRQLWYDFNSIQPRKPLSAQDRIKFMFGDILELILIFLAKEAGHDVTKEQAEVKLDGITGHIDAIIDDVLVDAKSCSSFSFSKFVKGDLKDDPFGYQAQLAGYCEASGGMDGAFLAIDKQHGDITLLPIGSQKLKQYEVKDRIKRIKAVLSKSSPPERCYEDVPHGKSGNRMLSTGCKFCAHKFECWSDVNDGTGLATYTYSDGLTYLTKVTKEPKVPKISIKE